MSQQPWLTFLYSYPNEMPLSAAEVRDVVRRTEPDAFDALYGPEPDYVIARDAKNVIQRSADRYIGMVEGTWPRR